MAQLKDKIENVLNESRILVLGIQILIGLAFKSFFEPGFAKMPHDTQLIQLAMLGLMLLGFGLLLVPAPYHRIVLHGRNTGEFHRLGTFTVTAGLLPFAMAMGLVLFLGARWVLPTASAAIFAGVLFAVTFLLWYGLELLARSRKVGGIRLYAIIDPLREIDMKEEQETDLTTRVKQVLIECRVVLPGAQALLGFQLIIMWMTAFYKMPQLWKLIHLASLTSVAICTILLIAPAAYHRIVDQGNDSEMLHHITARALLAAMVFLALGICGDFYLASRLSGVSMPLSAAVSLLLLVFFYGAWFGYTTWKKHAVHNQRLTQSHLKEPKAA